MSFQVDADLVPLFRGLVTGLQPFASAQEVELLFESSVENLLVFHNTEDALSEIAVLLSRVITFTPQSYTVKVSLGKCAEYNDRCVLAIENTGVNLSKLGEILSSVKNGLIVEKLKQGTRFIVSIPTNHNPDFLPNKIGNRTLLPKQYPNYHAAVVKRLTTHFSNSKNMEKAAALKSNSEGVFLKKINTVIQSHISDPDFKVDTLASAMAISRAQLFRKIRTLTQMSPQKYLRFVRLEKAKKLLQSKDKDLNVSEVCYRVGFASKSHFTRSFQKKFGFNPSEYIKTKNAT